MIPEEFHEDLVAGDTTAKPPDKIINTWNRAFAATAHMDALCISRSILLWMKNEGYFPKNASDAAVFKEMQTFMYAVFRVGSWKITWRPTRVNHCSVVMKRLTMPRAQRIYRELKKKHDMRSTVAHLYYGDALLQHITTACFPGSWRSKSYGFVLHWSDKQKLFMLQNDVGDVSEITIHSVNCCM